ncbi:MAG: PorT family protein [Saprospiraceae bacterium]|nr:PorT family protein [Saprospiraceae bacterium]
MLSLRGKKIKGNILILLCLFYGGKLLAQHGKHNINFDGLNKKNHYYGLTVGYNYNSFKIEHSKRLTPEGTFRLNEPIGNSGLTLCMITNFKMGEYFDFRILPTIAISNRTLSFTPNNSKITQEQRIESVFGEIPILLRFTSEPYKDKRVFLLSGIKYSYDFSSNARVDKRKFDLVRISPHDFQIEIGAGLQFYMPYFIFTPEIKYSHGLGNLLIYDGRLIESTVIDKLYSRTLTISLHFEG